MSFGEAVRAVLHRWSDFGGRSSRTEFWFWWLATLGLYLGAVFVAAAVGRQAGNAVFAVMALVYLVLLIPSLAVFVRRLHDSGRSGWWWLIGLIPIGGIVLLVFMCLDSTPGPNAFGAPPRGSRHEHPSTWRTYLSGPPAGWGVPGNQQPGWGTPPPPPGPPSGWGTTPAPAPRPGMTPPPSGAPVPAWQQTQAQTAWQQPPAAPPAAPSAWQQPPTQAAAPTAPAAAPSAWQQAAAPPAAPSAPTSQAGPVTPAPDPWNPATVACRTCGQSLTAEAAFCSRCGRPTAG